MSNIDWSRPLEAYHEDGRVVDCQPISPDDPSIWPDNQGQYHIDGEGVPLFFEKDGTEWREYSPKEGWRIRNKAEPKADAFDVAFKEDNSDIPQWAWDRMKAEYIDKDGMAASFARYIMTKEEPPVDPDLIEARELVCAFDHDKWPDDEWHRDQARLTKGGSHDSSWRVIMALEGIKRGRELERGEVK